MKSYPGEERVKRFLLNHNWDAGKRLLEEVMNVSEDASALNDMALLCARTGQHRDALALLERAMQKPDKDIRTWINYFYISEVMGLNKSRGENARSRILDMRVGDDAFKPRLSIVMRTFNRGDLIESALRSVLLQSLKEWELIIVNDGGDRNVERVIDALWDKRMVYVYARHSGPAGAFNVGLRLARGEYIGFLDDDDIIYPESWDRMVNHLDMHPETKAVYSDINLVWMDLKTGKKKKTRLHKAFEFKRERLWTGFYMMNLLTLVLRRECLDKMPGFLEGLKSAVDWEFMLALCHFIGFDYIEITAGELRYWKGLEQVGKRSVLERNHQRNIISYYHGITPFYKFGLGENVMDEKFLDLLDRLLKKFPELVRGLEMRKLLKEPLYAVFYQLGVELMREGKNREARECFRCAFHLAPKEIKIWARFLESWF